MDRLELTRCSLDGGKRFLELATVSLDDATHGLAVTLDLLAVATDLFDAGAHAQ